MEPLYSFLNRVLGEFSRSAKLVQDGGEWFINVCLEGVDKYNIATNGYEQIAVLTAFSVDDAELPFVNNRKLVPQYGSVMEVMCDGQIRKYKIVKNPEGRTTKADRFIAPSTRYKFYGVEIQ